MTGVFISYSRHDKVFADHISGQLKKHGLEVFVDYQRLLGGEAWAERLGEEINKRSSVLFVISPNSLRSEWVHDEISYARSINKTIIPVIMNQIKENEWAKIFFLRRREQVDFSPWYVGKRTDDAVAKLLTALKHHNASIAHVKNVLTPENAGKLYLTHSLLSGPCAFPESVDVSADGCLLAVGMGKTKILDTRTWSQVADLSGLWTSVVNAAFSQDCNLVGAVYGGAASSFELWSVPKKQAIGQIDGGVGNSGRFAFSPDSRTLAWPRGPNVGIWDVIRRSKIGELKVQGGKWFGLVERMEIYDLAFSPSGDIIAGASSDKTVRLWHAKSFNPIGSLIGHRDEVNCVRFSPDGLLMASGSKDNTVIIWDISRHQEIATLSGHAGQIRGVAFSPDSRLIASAAADKTVRIYASTNHTHIATLRHSGRVGSVTFSPDGSLLISGSDTDGVKIWSA